MRASLAEDFDRLAERVFADQGRLVPLLDRFDAELGRLREDDEDLRLLQAIRVDWALCDAAIDGPGDTWATRVARGSLDGVEPDSARDAARSIAGLFEVWPAEPHAWLRDRIGGICVRLLDRVGPFEARSSGRPAALWELRLVPDDALEGVRMVRPPLRYPLAAARELESQHPRRFADPPWPSMLRLRKARLHWARSGQRFWRL